MFGRFRRRSSASPIASSLYGAIVAQARSPALYADLGVADTVDGRFEMVVLHTALVLRRLSAAGETARGLGQEIFDLFCADMDRSLRAMGIGDLGVPKRMKKMAESFYGRSAAYADALDRDRAALGDAIARNVFAGEGEKAPALADYAAAVAGALAAQPPAAIAAGELSFPAAASFGKAAAS
jgi:cytochrome b pre-mRNA-processing protein 3